MTKQDTETDANNDDNNSPRMSPDQLAEWGNEIQFKEPPVKNEQGQELRSQARDDLEQAQKDNEEEDDNAGEEEEASKTGKDDTTGEATTDEEDQDDAPEVHAVEDPGEFKPADHSFEVVIYEGEEGKERPKTVKITSVEQAEELLERDPNFGSAKNLLNFNRKVAKMENSLEREQADYQKRKQEYEDYVKKETDRQNQVNRTVKEMNYLVDTGKLPKISKQYQNADWSDPEVAKQPGVKEHISLLKYMAGESKRRVKAGLEPLTSVLDAYNAWNNDQAEQDKIKRQKQAGEFRRQQGSRVSGTSPAPNTTAPKGIAVGRGGSLRDLNAGWN